MRSSNLKRQRLWVASVVLFWLAVGLSLPFLSDFAGEELNFDNAQVVAAPLDTYHLPGSLVLDNSTGTVLSGGTLALAVSKDKPVTAEVAANQLKNGSAVLLLSQSEIAVGATEPVQSPPAENTAPLIVALQTGRFKALAVRNSVLVVELPGGHQERLSGTDVHMVAGSDGGIEAKGNGYWRGQRTRFSVTTGRPDKAGRIALKLDFKATLIDFVYDGSFTLNADREVAGAAKVNITDADTFARAMGTSWPISSGFQQVGVEGPLRWQGKILAFDQASVRIGSNEADGTVSINTQRAGSVISGTLAFDRLDATPFFPSSMANGTPAHLFWQAWSRLADTLSQPSAPHINADLRLSAKKLIAGTYELGPAAASISVKDGRLSADIAEVALDGGRATGQISIDFNRYVPKIALRGQLENIAFGRWTEHFAGARYIEGQGRMLADLTSQGATLPQIIGDLAGRIELVVPDGGAIGLSLAELDASYDKNHDLTSREIFAKAVKGSTRISSLDAVWKVRDGIGTLANSSAIHATGALQASGTYDLNRSAFEFRLLSVAGVTEARQPVSNTATTAAPKAELKPQRLTHSAKLMHLRSPEKNDVGGAVDIRILPLSGTAAELHRFLGPDFPQVSGSSL